MHRRLGRAAFSDAAMAQSGSLAAQAELESHVELIKFDYQISENTQVGDTMNGGLNAYCWAQLFNRIVGL
jgi:hypothetical protein